MKNNIIASFLLFNYLFFIKKNKLYKIFTISHLTYLLLILSFLTGNNKLTSLTITLVITNLISKMIILNEYRIKHIDDFMLHYMTAIVALVLFLNMKKKDYRPDLLILLSFLLIVYILNHIYKVFMNDWVYRQINLYSLTGNLKLLGFFIIVMIINYLLKMIK